MAFDAQPLDQRYAASITPMVLSTQGLPTSVQQPIVDDFGGTTFQGAPLLQRCAPGLLAGESATLVSYQMMGMDALVDGLYATWIVMNAPDFTGAQYAGGLNTPLRRIAVQAQQRG